MKIGFVGLGKLGLPCALAIEAAGHEVVGYDPSIQVSEIINTRKLSYKEEGAQPLLDRTNIKLVTHNDIINDCDLVFVAVQTPHDPKYEGATRLPYKRVDFNYTHLKQAIKQIADSADTNKKTTRVVVISTVLPGTVDREIRPLLGNYIRLCYNPFFIAMGTTVYDFTHPEFVLFGVDDQETAELAEKFYRTIHNRPFYKTTIRNAELIKVAYNTYISTKIAFVNTLMEVCHKTNCDVNAVTDALKMANERLISTRYMTGGMGDGGGCHPRDNIALSWLARELEMKYDFFEAIMLSREKQNEWFADMIEEYFWQNLRRLPIIILGEAFKPETNITTGSPARLLFNILDERGVSPQIYDPVINGSMPELIPAIYFIGCKHEMFATLKYPTGSIVLDPHRYVVEQEKDVKLVRIGESNG